MSDPVITVEPAPQSISQVLAKPKPLTPIRWSFIAAWAIAAFALLLALFAWLPWVYPRAAAMTPFGQLAGQLQKPAVTVLPPDSNPADESRIEVLEDKLAALVAQLADQSQLAVVDAQIQQETQDKIATDIRADSIKAATQMAAQVAAQAAGEAASTAARDVAKGTAISTVAPLLAAARLEDRLARGAAYQSDLASLSPQLSETERADLAPLAGGAADNAALVAQLDAQQRPLLATYRESLATGWWDKLCARLSTIITITAADSAPDGAAARYAKLRAQIVQNDFTSAVATLQMLPQAVQDGLQPVGAALTARARAQRALHDALARLTDPAARDGTRDDIPVGKAR